ncbi:unnamed protein product [Phytophthora fragariaefolia]|uniref:Unnamed protein product n=1 Tax=Phytophthora fragariaefolia TaxID=1490495 RepID=A0A9W6XJ75_9STRA|nr:unnamed protein product [Phytophthora fragariaefolia]
MGELRDGAVGEMENFLSETLAHLAVDEMATMRDIVQTFRILVVYFRKSPKARTCLENIQKELGVAPDKVVTFKVDCPTRWNSCWDMLARCIQLQPALNAFFVYLHSSCGRIEFKDMQNKLNRPKDADWFAIKCLKSLLEPFDEVTRTLGGQGYQTLPLVLPVLVGLRHKIAQNNLFEQDRILAGNEEYVNDVMVTMKECRNTVLRLFDNRFSHLASSELAWVSYLDPRVAKYMNHLSDEQIPDARKKNLIAAAVQLVRDEVELTERGVLFSPEPVKKQESSTFITTFVFGPDDASIPKTTLTQNCSDEFTRYLADITAPNAVLKPRILANGGAFTKRSIQTSAS